MKLSDIEVMKAKTYFVEEKVSFYGIHLYDAEPYNLKSKKSEYKHLKKKEDITIIYNPLKKRVRFKSRGFNFFQENIRDDRYKVVV